MRQPAVAAALVAMALVLLLAVPALGAEPSTLPAGVVEGGDPRSEGAGPGIVGSPLLILGAVVVLGVATALVTLVLVRLSRRG